MAGIFNNELRNTCAEIIAHPVIIITSKKDRSLLIESILSKLGFKSIILEAIPDVVKISQQELPHLIISDAILKDGHAGNLFDKLQENSFTKQIPVLALVIKKTKEELSSIAKRKFAGFILGDFDAKILITKIRECLDKMGKVSPFMLSCDRLTFTHQSPFKVEATIVGKYNNHLIARSITELDPQATLIGVPRKEGMDQIILAMPSNLKKGNEIFNLFPLNRLNGKGRMWVNELPDFNIDGQGQPKKKVTNKRILFYDPNEERLKGFKQILEGYGFEIVPVKNMQSAASVLNSKPEVFPCIYLHELLNDANGLMFKKVFDALSPNQKPNLLIGTSSVNVKSTSSIRYIKRPFGLGVFVETLESSIQKPEQIAEFASQESSQGANIILDYQAQADLLAIDEIGGFLSLKFPLLPKTKVKISHPQLLSAWNGKTEIFIESIKAAKHNPHIHVCRFRVCEDGVSKLKFWEKVSEQLKSFVQAEPTPIIPPVAQEKPEIKQEDIQVTPPDNPEGNSSPAPAA